MNEQFFDINDILYDHRHGHNQMIPSYSQPLTDKCRHLVIHPTYNDRDDYSHIQIPSNKPSHYDVNIYPSQRPNKHVQYPTLYQNTQNRR